MNTKQLITRTLGAGVIILGGLSFIGCSEEEEVVMIPEVKNCMPTSISSDLLTGKDIAFFYDEQDRVNRITATSGEDQYSEIAVYDDQGRLVSLTNDADSSYHLIEYSEQSITQNYFRGKRSFEQDKRFVYETDASGRIVSKTMYHFRGEELEKMNTEDFTYDEAGNVIQLKGTDWYEGEEYGLSITYDDKINPYHSVGFDYSGEAIFHFISLSKNNPVLIEWEEDQSESRFTYEYDETGNPIKSSASAHLMQQEYDSEGNPVGEPEEVVETYESNITFSCQ